MEETNYQKLKALPTKEFWERVSELQSKTLRKYIDYPAWLDSTDPDISHFIKKIGTCKLYPSQAECAMSGYSFEPARSKYREEHARDMLVLEQKLMFSQPYFVVAGKDGSGDFLSVPATEIGELSFDKQPEQDEG